MIITKMPKPQYKRLLAWLALNNNHVYKDMPDKKEEWYFVGDINRVVCCRTTLAVDGRAGSWWVRDEFWGEE